jgi:hypothetical protein
MRTLSLRRLILPLALLALSHAARANQTVTACNTDTQTGAGINLATALAAGGDIFIQCPRASVIRITRRYTLNSETQLIGLNSATLADNIVLDGAGLAGPFLSASVGKLTVQALSFKNFVTGDLPANFSHVPSIADAENIPTIDGIGSYSFDSVIDARGDVELDQVQITASESPVRAAGAMTINNSWFGGNKGTVVMFLGVGTVNSSDFENNGSALDFHQGTILGSTFNGHSLAAISVTLPLRSVTIRNCNFSNGSGNPAIGITTQSSNTAAATVIVRGDNFLSNNGGGEAGAIAIRELSSSMSAAAAYFAKLPATTFQIYYDDFESNQGAAGGALDLELRPADSLAIVGGTFIRNTTTGSGGAVNVRSGQVSIAHSMFKANTAATGAAIAEAPQAQLIVANSLIVENIALSSAAVTGSQLVLENVTVANNRATGIAADTPAKSQFTNLLLSQNQPNNCSGFPASSFIGPNDQFGPTACAGSTISGDPQLDSFYIPTPGNSALVLGDAGACAKSPVDGTDLVFQARGKGVCALGAFERPPPQFKPPAPTQGPYAPKTAVSK